MRMPGTATLYHGRLTHLCEIVQPTPLAARPGGGMFTASTAGYPSTSKVLVWRLGAASSTTVASKHGEDFKVPQMAADPNGRIWVGWMDHSGTVFLRRSNPNATRWGATVRVRPPKGTLDGFELHLSAQAGVVDLLARFQSLHEINVFHIQAHPGLTFSASPLSFSHKDSHTVHFVVRDAGDPVNGAKVKVDGKSDTTNAQGKAEIKLGPFARRRWLTATATAPGYAPAHLRLRAH
jgi:hypothetical protein